MTKRIGIKSAPFSFKIDLQSLRDYEDLLYALISDL
jgi:hypothetical protein